MTKSRSQREHPAYLFKYLLAANFLEYLEAGAVPALLLNLAKSFDMNSGQLGLLGGIVYLSLSFGGPFAGYLLRHYDHQLVVGVSISINNFFTLLWALTPVGYHHSSAIFIFLRFLMGFTQCAVCVFMPLWTNEFAPKDHKTSWMSYQQVIERAYGIFIFLPVIVGYNINF
jgi:MFS family permease